MKGRAPKSPATGSQTLERRNVQPNFWRARLELIHSSTSRATARRTMVLAQSRVPQWVTKSPKPTRSFATRSEVLAGTTTFEVDIRFAVSPRQRCGSRLALQPRSADPHGCYLPPLLFFDLSADFSAAGAIFAPPPNALSTAACSLAITGFGRLE